MTDDNWIAKTIVPKSDQLNAEDMLTGPINVTIQDVRQGDADQPVAITIAGRQPYKPCKTMRRLLIAVWGDRASEWIGRAMTLYADPDVKWGGVAVGGIRISHVSHIDTPHTLMLTVTRGKRQAFTVKPLIMQRDWAAEFTSLNVVEPAKMIRDAQTADQRNEVLAEALKDKSICEDGYKLLCDYAESKS